MNRKLIVLIPVIASMVSMIPIIVYAQITTQKSFHLGDNPSGTLDDFSYNNGDQLQYDVAGYPPITIVIHRWNELSMVNQNLINVRLAGMGYIEGEVTPSGLEAFI